jgi:hypothetical protein
MAMNPRRGRARSAPGNDPDGEPRLIEPETLAAGGCRRDFYATVDLTRVPESARRVVAQFCAIDASEQPAVALALGFEFDPRRLKPDELLRRLLFLGFLRRLGARHIIASPVLYLSRPRCDLYSTDREVLVAVNHLTQETEVAQHVMHRHARTVLWLPVGESTDEPTGPVRRYTPLTSWPPQRNWFDEMVRQNERQSIERREARVAVKGLEAQVGAYRSAVSEVLTALGECDALEVHQTS